MRSQQLTILCCHLLLQSKNRTKIIVQELLCVNVGIPLVLTEKPWVDLSFNVTVFHLNSGVTAKAAKPKARGMEVELRSNPTSCACTWQPANSWTRPFPSPLTGCSSSKCESLFSSCSLILANNSVLLKISFSFPFTSGDTQMNAI